EKGFIRAEVIAYEDLTAAGSMAQARERGLVRLEGKDYVVQDGDGMHFRFAGYRISWRVGRTFRIRKKRTYERYPYRRQDADRNSLSAMFSAPRSAMIASNFQGRKREQPLPCLQVSDTIYRCQSRNADSLLP